MQRTTKIASVVAVLTLVTGGLAIGAPTTGGSIFACLSASAGTLTKVSTKAPKCPRGTTLISWNQVGPQGKQGAAGAAGAPGQAGLNGLNGLTGLQGPQGLMGPIGPQGPKGETGVQGQEGVQGPKGEAGAEGLRGEKGDQGAEGPMGPQGKVLPSLENGFEDVLVASDGQEYVMHHGVWAGIDQTLWNCFSPKKLDWNGYLTEYGWVTPCNLAHRGPLTPGPLRSERELLIGELDPQYINVAASPRDVFVYKSADCSGEEAGYILRAQRGWFDSLQYSPVATELQDRIFQMAKSNWNLSDVKSYRDINGCNTSATPNWPQIWFDGLNSESQLTLRYVIVKLREVRVPEVTFVDGYREWRGSWDR
jgi:hypothetical protein